MVSKAKEWFQEACPEPSQRDIDVQVGCHFEEVYEMTVALGIDGSAIKQIADDYKQGRKSIDMSKVDRVGLIDAIGDQIVTGTGVSHMMGMDIIGALAEINRSNFTKFVDGKAIRNENGKIIAGPLYERPSLEEFV